MCVIVTDLGFSRDDWSHGFAAPEARGANDMRGLHLSSDTDPAALTQLMIGVGMIRIDFPSFADGRGFTLGRQLRLIGYRARLRAGGHVIADQYAMVRRAGFDEVEIDAALAARQPEDQWLFRSNWRDHDHQSRLQG